MPQSLATWTRFATTKPWDGVARHPYRPPRATESRLGSTHRRHVDYGPLLECDFAGDAGIGWNGKSSVQIRRSRGTHSGRDWRDRAPR